MANMLLPPDFKEFLQLLNSKKIEYLVVGGYAVGYYGYPRATGDLDIWIASHQDNAELLAKALIEFGFSSDAATPELFLVENQIVRMGCPPIRIELFTSVSGIAFEESFNDRKVDEMDGVSINFISLEHLKINKKASGRSKDLNDLENLP